VPGWLNVIGPYGQPLVVRLPESLIGFAASTAAPQVANVLSGPRL
jgi:hypothetical protein